MSSILTNNGAMVALQTLKSINNDLGKTQNAISTGKVIANAKDNSAIWAISKVMESDVQGFKAVSQSLSLGESTVAVARGAAEAVTDALKLMKEEIVAAQDGTVDRTMLQERIDALKDQIDATVGAAQVNGVNLVDGNTTGLMSDGTTAGLSVISSLNRDASGVTAAYIDIAAVDLTTATLTDGTTALEDLDVSTDDASALAALDAIDVMINLATTAAASFGSAQSRIEIQNDFVSKLSDSLKSGIGSLVDADMEAASARLQALQTQQQLGVQSLSIANQAPQTILSLFR